MPTDVAVGSLDIPGSMWWTLEL